MFRPAAAIRAIRRHHTAAERMRSPQREAESSSPIDDRATARSVDRAIDCWCHGVAHLLSALGPQAALSLMARTVVDLADRNEARAPTPHSV